MQMRWIKEIWQLTCLARSSGHDIRYKILGDQLEVDVLTRNPKTFVIPKNYLFSLPIRMLNCYDR